MSLRSARMAMAIMTMTACWVEELEPVPGGLRQEVRGNWVQGEESEVFVGWNNANDCGASWSCKPTVATVTLLDVQCSGCNVQPRTESATVEAGQDLRIGVVPTTDLVIQLNATLRFDATGDIQTVIVWQQGDHEVEVSGHCRLIDTAALHARTQGGEPSVPAEYFRACTTPRLLTDSVAVFPVIRTYRGSELFPFNMGHRTREQMTFSASSALWSSSHALPTGSVVELPRDFAAAKLIMTSPLADGRTATGSIDIPAVAPARPTVTIGREQ